MHLRSLGLPFSRSGFILSLFSIVLFTFWGCRNNGKMLVSDIPLACQAHNQPGHPSARPGTALKNLHDSSQSNSILSPDINLTRTANTRVYQRHQLSAGVIKQVLSPLKKNLPLFHKSEKAKITEDDLPPQEWVIGTFLLLSVPLVSILLDIASAFVAAGTVSALASLVPLLLFVAAVIVKSIGGWSFSFQDNWSDNPRYGKTLKTYRISGIVMVVSSIAAPVLAIVFLILVLASFAGGSIALFNAELPLIIIGVLALLAYVAFFVGDIIRAVSLNTLLNILYDEVDAQSEK